MGKTKKGPTDQIWPHGILLLQLLRPRSFEGMKPGYGHHCLTSYFKPLFKSKMSKKDKSSLFCLLKPAVELSSDFFPFTVSTPVFLFCTVYNFSLFIDIVYFVVLYFDLVL